MTRDREPTTAPYGSWKSPISAQRVAAALIRLSQTHFAGDALYWLEGRPAEQGRSVVVRRGADGAIGDVFGPDWNARTLVHEYGGGDYWVHGSTIFFANFADQRLYRTDGQGAPAAITPEPPRPGAHRYADFRATPDGRWLVAVRERWATETNVINELVVLPTDGSTEPRILVGGNDFYAAPRISPDGRRLAWISWNHPNMPWDGTELWVAELAPDATLRAGRQVAGGSAESIVEPSWSPGGQLFFVSDRSGWWNICREGDGAVEHVTDREAEFAGPLWGLGPTSYVFVAEERIVAWCNQGGEHFLVAVDARSGKIEDLRLPYRSTFGRMDADAGGSRVSFVAAGPTDAPAVALLDVDSSQVEIVRRSLALEDELEPALVSVAEQIEFPTAGDRTANALFYAPRNPDYAAPAGELPPLLVWSHGGPTGQTDAALDLHVQYWTSRGIAVVDVNYGGSTGYGRAYRERLLGQWGIVDVEDCIAAARYLAGRGAADPARLAIAGGSAGGYTTLCALTFHDLFAAGTSAAGIGDLEILQQGFHKFESRYSESLVAPYPEGIELYRARSPVHFFDRLSTPLLVIQGLEDEIVPPSQAEAIVAALRRKRIPYAYLAFAGEQHGLRRAENIVRALQGELYFYSRIFGFSLADEIEPISIEFLSGTPPADRIGLRNPGR